VNSGEHRAQISGMLQDAVRGVCIVIVVLAAMVVSTQSAHAQMLKVLHSFSGMNGDGDNVWSTLLNIKATKRGHI